MAETSKPTQLGIFAKTFARPRVEEVFQAVCAQGIHHVQFNFASAGLASMPDVLEPTILERIRIAAENHRISLDGLSGTFNMIHPDLAIREPCFQRFQTLVTSCRALGVSTVTLCTGTRDPHNMWQAHPDNQSPAAWRDLRAGLDRALAVAAEENVILAVEPETSNVMNSAAAARRLLDEVQSAHLKVILDPANLFHGTNLTAMQSVIDEAVDLLGADMIMAHAKELSPEGYPSGLALGRGALDWDYYLSRLQEAKFTGPVIMHGFAEKDAAASFAFLRDKWNRLAKN